MSFVSVVEHGDSSEANTLYGAPAITLDKWFRLPKDSESGWPHKEVMASWKPLLALQHTSN